MSPEPSQSPDAPAPTPPDASAPLPPDAPTPYKVARRWPVVSAVTALVFAVAIGALVVVRTNGLPFEIDEEWMDEVLENRTPVLVAPSLFMNYLGGGVVAVFVIPLVVIAALLVFRRPWAALYFTISIIASAALVQIIKTLVGRPRPEDMLVVSDFGSFPSGHSANAATLAVTMGIVFVRVWIWVAGSLYTVVMMLSRTYLGAHWLTDTIGGMLLGVGVAVLLWAPLAAKLYTERSGLHRPIWVRPATLP